MTDGHTAACIGIEARRRQKAGGSRRGSRRGSHRGFVRRPLPLQLQAPAWLNANGVTPRSQAQGLRNPRDPSIQIIPTLGPKVCKYYLHWAIWIFRGTMRATGLMSRSTDHLDPSTAGWRKWWSVPEQPGVAQGNRCLHTRSLPIDLKPYLKNLEPYKL